MIGEVTYLGSYYDHGNPSRGIEKPWNKSCLLPSTKCEARATTLTSSKFKQCDLCTDWEIASYK